VSETIVRNRNRDTLADGDAVLSVVFPYNT